MAKDLRQDITGLRAIAVVSVTLYHIVHVLLPTWGFMQGGFLGVDIFFVISGFLMTMIIMKGLERNSFNLVDFYQRRAKRICPALAITILVFVGLGVLLLGTKDLKHMSFEGFYALLFVSNIYFAEKTDYFGNSAIDQVFLHTWSLSVEWQFYLFYPVILMVLKRYLRIPIIKRAILILTIVTLFFAAWYTAYYPRYSYYLLPSRAFELLFGALAYFYPLSFFKAWANSTTARVYKQALKAALKEKGQSLKTYLDTVCGQSATGTEDAANASVGAVDANEATASSEGKVQVGKLVRRFKKERRLEILLKGMSFKLKCALWVRSISPTLMEAIGLIIIAVSLVIVDDKNGWPTMIAVLPLFGTYLCIAANNKKSLLSNVVLQKLGLWSYAIYLVHWPIIVLFSKLGFYVWSFELLVPIVILALMLHYFVEQRRNYGYLFLGFYCVIGALSYSLTVNGAEFRLKNNVTKYAQYGGHTVPFEGVENSIGNERRIPDFILIGDSFARHYTLDLIDRGLHVITVFRDGCYSFGGAVSRRSEGYVDEKCLKRYENTLATIKKYPHLPIAFAQDWPRYKLSLETREGHKVTEKEFEKQVLSDLERLSEDLKPITKAQIYIIGTPSQTVFDIGSTCMFLHELDNPLSKFMRNHFSCVESKDLIENPINDKIKAEVSKFKNFHYIDPNDALCKNGKCKILVDRYIPVFQDGLHYSWAGSIKVVSHILETMGLSRAKKERTDFEDNKVLE